MKTSLSPEVIYEIADLAQWAVYHAAHDAIPTQLFHLTEQLKSEAMLQCSTAPPMPESSEYKHAVNWFITEAPKPTWHDAPMVEMGP